MSRSKAEVDKIRAEMKRAVRYRSGPGLMNTIYLGGLATAGILHCFGTTLTLRTDLQQAIDEASDGQIENAHEYQGYQWIPNHYQKAGSKLYRYETKATEVD